MSIGKRAVKGNPVKNKSFRDCLKGKKRALLAGGTLLAVISLATVAAFTDFANLNLGNGTEGSGIGNPDKFDIAVVLPTNVIEQADTAAGYDWEVAGADKLTPGGSVTTTIPVFNNTPSYGGKTDFAIELLNGDGSIGSAPNIVQFLRFTAKVDGATVFTDVTWDQAQGTLGVLAARGGAALATGATYSVGDAGSAKTIELTIKYLDDPATVNFNGGLAALRLHLGAESV